MLHGAKGLAEAVDRIAAKTKCSSPSASSCRARCSRRLPATKPVVLLIDEIDKADAEFEAFLLELLSDFQVTGAGNRHLQGQADAAGGADLEQRARDVRRAQAPLPASLHRLPGRGSGTRDRPAQGARGGEKLAEEVVDVVQSLRKLDLKKTPGISETLDWVKALTLLNVQSLDQELVNETLDTIVKYEGDVRKAQEELKDYVRRARARRGDDAGSGRGSERQGFAQLSEIDLTRRTAVHKRSGAEASNQMEEKLVEFANLLRQNGVRVSLAETLDAFAAADVTRSWRARRVPLCAARHDDQAGQRAAGLRGAVRAVFLRARRDHQAGGAGVQEALSMSDQEFQKFLEQVEEMLKKQGKKLSELAQAAAAKSVGPAGEADCARLPAPSSCSDIERTIEENYFARALARALGLDKMEQEIKRAARADSRRLDFGAEMKAQMEEYLDRRLKRSRTSSAGTCGWSVRSATCKAREEQRLNKLGEKSFYYLSEEELKQMNEAVTRLAQRLKNVSCGAAQARQEGPLRHQTHAAPEPRLRRRAVQAEVRAAQAARSPRW